MSCSLRCLALICGQWESLKVYEQMNDVLRGVLCKDQPDCAVEDRWEWREIRGGKTS